MKTAFATLEKEVQVPSEVKEELFQSLDGLIFLADLIDLFVMKFPQSQLDLIDAIGNQTDVGGEEF